MTPHKFIHLWQYLLALLTIFGFFLFARFCMFESVQERLVANAAAASLAIDGDLIEKIQNPEDQHGEAYKSIHATLRRLVNLHSDIAFVYTMRKNSAGQVEFVVDSQLKQDANGDGILSPSECPATIGQPYANATEDMLNGFRVPSVDSRITHDLWGRFLSGYAPLRNRQNAIVGLVGVDMRLDELDAKLNKLVLGLIFSILLCSLPQLIWGIRWLFLGKRSFSTRDNPA